MALSRIVAKNAFSSSEMLKNSGICILSIKPENIHISKRKQYPKAPELSLPVNFSEIFNNETGRFTPERVRDLTTPVLLFTNANKNPMTIRNNQNWAAFNDHKSIDNHVDSYDCFGSVSLNSSMQTNVPKPFCSSGKSNHMNMPGGSWATTNKFISEKMQKSHYANLKPVSINGRREMSSKSSSSPEEDGKLESNSQQKLTNAQKLKLAVKDYGSTVIVFHVAISLTSLGLFYLLVSSGIDVAALVKMFPGSNEKLESIMTNSSTFLIAYAVHKVFAPVRISITLGATPFIVRYLRQIGFLKVK